MISLLAKNSRRMISNAKSVKTSYIAYKDGGPKQLHLDSREIKAEENQVLMKVKAVGINRAECLQRQGKYPIGRQAEKYLGLEAAGQVYDPQTNEKLYDGMALLSGGSYAQWAYVPKTHVMQLPKTFDFVKGAAIPEAWITAFQLIRYANLETGQSIVIYAAASGVGTAAIQICNLLGYRAFGVCSSAEKGEVCQKIGVKGMAYYKDNENWASDLLKTNDEKPFNAVLDCVGSSNVSSTLKLLATEGRWILFGLLSGPKTEINLAILLSKRITMISSTLKARSQQYKDQLIQDFQNKVLKGFDEQKLQPIIHIVMQSDWKSSEVFTKAHELMESNQNAGKIIIKYLD